MNQLVFSQFLKLKEVLIEIVDLRSQNVSLNRLDDHIMIQHANFQPSITIQRPTNAVSTKFGVTKFKINPIFFGYDCRKISLRPMSTFLSPSPINYGSTIKNKTKIDQILSKKAKLSVSLPYKFNVAQGFLYYLHVI